MDTIVIFSPAPGPSAASGLTFDSSFEQTNIIDTGGTNSETTSAAFSGAGTWLVLLGERANNDTSLALSGSAVSVSTGIANSTANNAVDQCNTWAWLVTTTGASNLTVTNSTATASTNRLIHIYAADGLTATGAITNFNNIESTSPTFTDPSFTLSSVPDGYEVAAIAFSLYSESVAAPSAPDGFTWNGDFVGDDELPVTTTDNGASSVASFTKSGTGDVTVAPTKDNPTFGNGSFAISSYLAVALNTA